MISLSEIRNRSILDIRAEFPDSSLADLYNPLTMPPKLLNFNPDGHTAKISWQVLQATIASLSGQRN